MCLVAYYNWGVKMKKHEIDGLKAARLAVEVEYEHGKIPRKYISKKEINPVLFITHELRHIGLDFYTLEYKEYIVVLDNKSLTYTAIPKNIKNELEYKIKENSVIFRYSPFDIYTMGFEFEINEKGRLILINNKCRRRFISTVTIFRVVTYIALLAWALCTLLR